MSDLSGTGIACPECGYPCDVVTDSRKREGFIMRRRECIGCGARVSTREVPTDLELSVSASVPLRIRWARNGPGFVAEVERSDVEERHA